MSYVNTNIISSVPPKVLDNQGMWDVNVLLIVKNDEDWREVNKESIEAWDRRMNFLPISEPFFSVDTVACLEYLSWFRLAGKSYLLSVEAMSRQLCQKRQ
ncbi:hypothetical protein GOBAR_AA35066 [Gossypium barbadense]|uniref:Uncharacterized protein n=1 Tax=Gossypium barbadense TaxID=3634 RepID=A0A2P5W3F7_GOSBA|nr:hypothetical protein GOBAR_AA35066 [Gossypium barbadense]